LAWHPSDAEGAQVIGQLQDHRKVVVCRIDDIQPSRGPKNKKNLGSESFIKTDGVEFSNTKDPAGNSIQISNRAADFTVENLADSVGFWDTGQFLPGVSAAVRPHKVRLRDRP
jgi:hypothetical protein